MKTRVLGTEGRGTLSLVLLWGIFQYRTMRVAMDFHCLVGQSYKSSNAYRAILFNRLFKDLRKCLRLKKNFLLALNCKKYIANLKFIRVQRKIPVT